MRSSASIHAISWICAAVAGFLHTGASGGVTEKWIQRYNNLTGDSVDQGNRVMRDPSGDYLVVGVTADLIAPQGLLLIKYSGADGSVIWQKRHAGQAVFLIRLSPPPTVVGAAVDAAGDLVVTTWADGSSGGTDAADYYTAKYAGTTGALIWERRYAGPAGGTDLPAAMALDESGNVVVTGHSQSGEDDPISAFVYPSDYYTAKYAAADGALLWERRYDGPVAGDDSANAVAVDGSGNVIVTGYSKAGPGEYDYDFYTAKYAAADGTLLWEKRFDNSLDYGDYGIAVAVDPLGDIAVTGSSYEGGITDFSTIKYAGLDGAVKWVKGYHSPANGNSLPTALLMDASGNVIVTGNSAGSGSGLDFYTAKYAAANGALLWEKRYNGPGNAEDTPLGLVLDSAGNVIATGYSAGTSTGNDYYTARYASASGALMWEKRYNGPQNGQDYAQAVASDGSGGAVVTGFSNFDIYTARYSAGNGAVLWEKRHSGPYNRDDIGRAVAVDPFGNVVMASSSVGDNSSDFYTAKYAAADGRLLWSRRYDGPLGGLNKPAAVAVDGSGNVVVTGESYGGTAAEDIYTAKYAAADGALLWERRYNGPGNSVDYSTGVATDADGNVVIVGYSSGGAFLDLYTAKYAAANGALLWEKRYRGISGGRAAAALTLDRDGDVLVTGSSHRTTSDSDLDFYTAKYAAVNGALLWERRYNGLADSGDQPSGIAVDGNGNAFVTGNSGSTRYTVKYAATNGSLLWERAESESEDGVAFSQAVAVDLNGDAVVTGRYYDWAKRSADYFTSKFAGANGALLWQKRYDGPAHGDDQARAIAVDPTGVVLITGESLDSRNRSDICTVAYSAEGSLLWERRYNGPASSSELVDGSHCLALGPDGIIAIVGSSDGSYQNFSTAYDCVTIVYRPTTSPASYAAWIAGYGLSGEVAAINADFDNDGQSNGLEYIGGGDPRVPSTAGLPTISSDGMHLVFTFFRDDAAETADVSLSVESGTDLVTWPSVFAIGATTAASTAGVLVIENGAAPDQISVTIPVGAEVQRFARLRVKLTP